MLGQCQYLCKRCYSKSCNLYLANYFWNTCNSIKTIIIHRTIECPYFTTLGTTLNNTFQLTTLTKMLLLTNNTFKINNHEKVVFSIFLLFYTKTPIELLAPSEAFPESRLSASTCGQSEPASKDS